MDTENDVEGGPGPITEEVLLHGPGRVKAGLLWLKGIEAKAMGLSLERLVERVAGESKNLSERFDLSHAQVCAIGFASQYMTSRSYAEVIDAHGLEWITDHGFAIGVSAYRHTGEDVGNAYRALTGEWRRQLQVLAEEETK